jgi:hypothetical protein
MANGKDTYISPARAGASLAEMFAESKRAFGRNVGAATDWMGDVGQSSAIGRGIGGYGVPALAYYLGYTNPIGLAVMSLLGSWGGSEIGQQWEGPAPSLRSPDVLLGEQDVLSQEQDLERMLSSFDASQITDAISDMTQVFSLGGGKAYLKGLLSGGSEIDEIMKMYEEYQNIDPIYQTEPYEPDTYFG